MEYLIMLILGLLGFGAYNYKKRKEAEVDAILGETKGQDKQLKKEQEEVEEAIKEIDAGMKKMREKREADKKASENLTDDERADRWNND